MNFLLATRLDKIFKVSTSIRSSKALLFHRVLVGADHREILSLPLSTVVDIGANRGQFALAVCQWAPTVRVISFEPLHGPAETFKAVFKGDAHVVLHEAAIGPVS